MRGSLPRIGKNPDKQQENKVNAYSIMSKHMNQYLA